MPEVERVDDVTEQGADAARTVLVVDDNDANRYVVGYWLRDAGFDVLEAVNGAEALDRARDRAHPPDLVVLDIRLPDTTGFEVLRLLREDAATAAIPVVHLSASFTTGEWRMHGLEQGAEAYLTHPVEPRELVATVRSLLRLREAESEREQLLRRERTARHDAEEARVEAERAAAVKAEFLATMSHEFRTPLNAFTGYLQLLEMELAGPLTAEQREYIERLKASAQHLTALVDDVLDLAKLDAGRMTVARDAVRTEEALTAALSLARPQADSRGVRLEDRTEGHGEPYLGDEHRVRQILLNLLSNAIKFTEPGGLVTVSVGREVDAAGTWTLLRVTDTGIGIPEKRLHSIFEPFVQVESGEQGPYRRTKGGTGLGLTISRRLARLMGGDLTVDSAPGEGATFTLSLPATEEARAPDATARPVVPALAAVRAGGGDRSASAGVGPAGDALRDDTNRVIDDFLGRLRADAALPSIVRAYDRRRLVGHVPAFLAAVAQTLQALDDPSGIPSASALRDHDQLQRTIAELHGRQRARLGWTAENLAGEIVHLDAALRDFVHRLGDANGMRNPAGLVALMQRFVQQLGRIAEQTLTRITPDEESIPQ